MKKLPSLRSLPPTLVENTLLPNSKSQRGNFLNFWLLANLAHPSTSSNSRNEDRGDSKNSIFPSLIQSQRPLSNKILPRIQTSEVSGKNPCQPSPCGINTQCDVVSFFSSVLTFAYAIKILNLDLLFKCLIKKSITFIGKQWKCYLWMCPWLWLFTRSKFNWWLSYPFIVSFVKESKIRSPAQQRI